jgi:integration host factor subunit alpha
MTKAEIVQALYTRVGGFSKKESADIVDMVFEMMKETLGRGEKIKISGFGNFVLRDKRQRPGRNPQTGDPIKISERRVLTFKASQILKQALNPRNGNGAHELIEDEPDEDEDDSSDLSEAPPPVAEVTSTANPGSTSAPLSPAPVAVTPLSNEAPKE